MKLTNDDVQLIQFLDAKYNPRKQYHGIWKGPFDVEHYFNFLFKHCTENEKAMVNEIKSRVSAETHFKTYQCIFTGNKRFNRNNKFLKKGLSKLTKNYKYCRKFLNENFGHHDKPLPLYQIDDEYRHAKYLTINFPHEAQELLDL